MSDADQSPTRSPRFTLARLLLAVMFCALLLGLAGVVRQTSVQFAPVRFQWLLFSPDGQYLAAGLHGLDRLDLHFIGHSIYEAHQKNGWWPTRIADLDGTEYFNMPYRKTLLEEGNFVVVWQQDLALRTAANRDRVLAYDNRSLLSRFGNVWVVRGDLNVEYMDRDELNELLEVARD